MRLVDTIKRRLPRLTGSRSYEAATGSARRFTGGTQTFGTWGAETSAAREPLQRRARHFEANNALARSGVSAWVTSSVGPGLLPTSQHPDPETRKAADAAFRRWARHADADGLTDFAGLTAAMVRAERIDGEGFAVWQGNRLRQVPAEQVDMSMTRDLPGGAHIASGVEFDHDGQRVGYWIHPAKPTELWPTAAAPVRLDASEVLHLFRAAGPGAVRGVSALAPVLLNLSELDGLTDAQLVNARMAALMSVILTNENDLGDGSDPLADGIGLEPGAILKFPGGWKVTSTAPQQAQQTAEFQAHLIRVIASGLDIPQHLLDGNIAQANYSSLRAALVAFRQKIEAYQFGTLVPQFLGPVWKRVMTEAVLSGELHADLTPDLLENVEWIPPAQPWVDPMKDAQATVALLENGLMSRRQAVAALGYSLEELDAEIAADKARTIGKDSSNADA